MQAMSLCKALLDEERTALPQTFALMALMCFHTARSQSRLSQEGNLILLHEQDRTTWDQAMIEQGKHFLNESAFGQEISVYHLEAAIAYEHCRARNFNSTDWPAICSYYELLCQRSPSVITFLNYCIVLMELEGPEKARETLWAATNLAGLKKYYLYYAFMGELELRLGHKDLACQYLQDALELTHAETERKHLQKKLEQYC
jgi:RNA polymerase sigma-70 factor (ECF subfamily)